MTARNRRVIGFALVVLVVVVAAGGYGWSEYVRSRDAQTTASDVDLVPADVTVTGNRIVFRSTAPGDLYGRVAAVAADDPGGPREVAPIACDRVDTTGDRTVCLRTDRGIVTTFEASVLDANWQPTQSWPLPGIPSRTRLSPDGSLVATTSFVTGHSYMSTGFSTETMIHEIGGRDYGNIEEFDLLVDGEKIAPVDRNMWGVTFADDSTFYATAQSRALGHTWLVRGDLETRTLSVVRDGVECPSLSPDGSRIAFKKDVDDGPGVHWSIAVLDVASGDETVLDEQRNVDDQVEWLDDDTLLYGLPRDGEAGVSDVWAVPATGGEPRVLIPQAWSPAVVRS
ncbi:TolB family protein [Jiangella endophytica]|uniref:TolB family protein n=1 Tax=Jiangella endophytica TaxID=1623398 RepID=UPI000E3539D7|nr:PD40 domain-containing protein [Jiangella endophytica]